MTRANSRVLAAALGLGATASIAFAAGDVRRGAVEFQQCAACHSVEPGRHLTGPSLAHVWGRKAATAEGFHRYSEALQRSGLTWNEETLKRWLAGPQRLVPGTAMNFAGVGDELVREDLVVYLKAVSEGKAPVPEGDGRTGRTGRTGAMGGMAGGMMSGSPANLKRAPAEAQVVALTHCHDTYTVKTAGGNEQKVWEYNLRLKTDSSKDGPLPGRPVMTGSGMQGDRFSIVFSSPTELSPFIREACD